VVWLDAMHPSGTWEEGKDLKDDPEMRVDTVGFLARRSKTALQVATSVSDVNDSTGVQYAGLMTIPVCCVVSITTLPASTLKK
jgi:hypothetical protein